MSHILRVFMVLFLFVSLLSCGGSPSGTQQNSSESVTTGSPDVLTFEERAFLDNLSGLCGNSYRGRETYMAPGRESWADKDFVMHVVLCEGDKVYIPFHLDDDHSRTWMFLAEEEGLRFRHDHRHPDGSPEELTLYGGYANKSGTPFSQSFPADEYTKELLTDTLGRQWNIVMDEDLTRFSYQLQYQGEIVFQADFDLSNPL